MTRQALNDLAARCEAATAYDQRELLQEAWTALNPIPDPPHFLGVGTYGEWFDAKRKFAKMLDVEAYESAAMTLVPEGWLWQIGAYARGEVCAPAYYRAVLRRWVRGVDGELSWPRVSRTAATPALALTAACLKALAQEIEHDK